MNSFQKPNPYSVSLDSTPCSSTAQIIKICLNVCGLKKRKKVRRGKTALRSKVSDCESLLFPLAELFMLKLFYL